MQPRSRVDFLIAGVVPYKFSAPRLPAGIPLSRSLLGWDRGREGILEGGWVRDVSYYFLSIEESDSVISSSSASDDLSLFSSSQ